MPTPSDLFLSPDLTEEDARAFLLSLGFRDPEATDRHLQEIAVDVVVREAMGRIAGELLPALLEAPDPDAAVLVLSHYLAARSGRAMFLDYLADDPRAMHVLACVFGSSPMLSEILVRNPDVFHWLVSQVERSAPEREDLEEELEATLANVEDAGEALDALKRWKRRELLRIATRDLLRRETVPAATGQLSDLAGVVVDRVLAIVTTERLHAESRATAPGKLAVIGLGALGGRELSYSADLDLIYVFEGTDTDRSVGPFFDRLAADLTSALAGLEHDSGIYRVRATTCALDDCGRGLNASGGLAERLALIQVRPVAGDPELGRRFVDAVRPLVFGQGAAGADVSSMGGWVRDGRSVEGSGARQVERVAQLLQLAHGGQNPALRQTGTLAALDAVAAAGLLPETMKRELAQAYIFLRTVEHRLQLVHESHTGLGSSEDLQKQVSKIRDRVSEICHAVFEPRL